MHLRQGSGLRSHRSAQSWTKDARGDSAATKRDAQSEFELPPCRSAIAIFVQSKDTADVNGTSSQATPSEAWWRTAVYRYKAIIGPEMRARTLARQRVEHRIRVRRYSTRWLRSGCPIRTAPGDSATGTGRSAICSGPCNNAALRLHCAAGLHGWQGPRDLVVTEYVVHYHTERNHQGLGNELITPLPASAKDVGPIVSRERLGGILNYYCRAA